MSAIVIKEVSSPAELKQFVTFPIALYKDNPYYVSPIILDEMNTLRKEINPSFDHCEAIYLMAYRGEKPVGRIAGIINHQVNTSAGERTVRFGYVDFVDDKEVSEALFAAVEAWGGKKGMTKIVGPLGFTDMDPEGMLVEGFDQRATMVTIYNAPYYPQHVEALGFEKEVDWVEYKIMVPSSTPEKLLRVAEIVRTKSNLRVVKFTSRKKLVKQYGNAIFKLINEAYADLFGYSTLTRRQIDYYVKNYISMLRLEYVTLIVNEADELIGVGVIMPSMSDALQKAKGKLFPLGFFYLLQALFGKPKVLDMLLVAIRPDYQNKGANALLISDLIPIACKHGVAYAESNPELELNAKVQAQWQYFDTIQHKRRRAFVKELSSDGAAK